MSSYVGVLIGPVFVATAFVMPGLITGFSSFLIAILSLFLYLPYLGRGVSVKMVPLFVLSLFFLVFVVVSGYSGEYGYIKYLSAVYCFFLLAIIFFIRPGFVKKIPIFLFYFFLVYGGVVVLFKIMSGTLFSRTMMGFNGPIVFSRYMLAAFIIGVFLLHKKEKLLSPLLIMFSYLSYSKGPILGLLLTISIKRIFFALFAFVIIFFYATSGYGEGRYINFVNDIYSAILSLDVDVFFSGYNYGSLGSRVESFFYVKDSFGFIGNGLGSWSLVTPSIHIYPHNLFLELLIELGVAGLIFLVLFILFALIPVREVNAFHLVAVFFFLNSLFSGDLIDNFFIFWFLVLGCLYRREVPANEI